MKKTKPIGFENPEQVHDVLTETLRSGARKILQEALSIEIESFIDEYKDLRLSNGHARVVRNGYNKERVIQTGIGDIPVQSPRAKDRLLEEESIVFHSKILPPYLRKAKNIEALLPWLYLKGISTGDFPEALTSLLGPQAKGLSAGTISRLKRTWEEEYKEWCRRDLSQKNYVYFWVDGVYCHVRMDQDKQCLLVIVAATEDGHKELIALEDGFRESEQSWKEVLLSLQHKGLKRWPKVAVGDGAMGFWKAFRKMCPESREQRCWMHKTGNILNKLPKSLQNKAKSQIHEIWMAETKEKAEKAFDHFINLYQAKYPKATECLAKDREVLLTFYEFPAEHWKHLRTTNPIESTFSTVKLRTRKVRGCFSRTTALTMAFKLMESAQKKWQRLNCYERLAEIIRGVKFKDGIMEKKNAA